MHRLNVRFTQIDECIRTSLFAVDALPRTNPLVRGEPLLLQLVLEDARRLGKERQRVEFALIFDEARPDTTGAISREHWPKAGKTWRWILYCSETVATVPFSLEELKLSKDYGGQTNAMFIEPRDQAIIRPYIKGTAAQPAFPKPVTVDDLLAAVRNHDRVYHLAPRRQSVVREHTRRLADSWLSDTLKILYKHRCQICLHDFQPRYGSPFADTRFIKGVDEGGAPIGANTVVLCPNHNSIIGVTRAEFVRSEFAYRFPNGLVEELTLRDHLLMS